MRTAGACLRTRRQKSMPRIPGMSRSHTRATTFVGSLPRRMSGAESSLHTVAVRTSPRPLKVAWIDLMMNESSSRTKMVGRLGKAFPARRFLHCGGGHLKLLSALHVLFRPISSRHAARDGLGGVTPEEAPQHRRIDPLEVHDHQ